MIRRPPISTQSRSSAASDVYKRQGLYGAGGTHAQVVGATPTGGSYAGLPKVSAEVSGPYVSCLLYTSTSPRDRTRSRMPYSA